MVWPAGRAGEMRLDGFARDLHTDPAGTETILATAAMQATIEPGRTVVAIRTAPDADAVAELVGGRGGGGFRKRLQSILEEDFRGGSPRYFLLDDLPAATLIGGFAWRLWPISDAERRLQSQYMAALDMTGICSGFQDGGLPARLQRMGQDTRHNLVPAKELLNPVDPDAWHDIPAVSPNYPTMRRRRRIDVRRDGDQLSVDAMFRDSIFGPGGEEMIVHEYQLNASADANEMVLTQLTAQPRVLPFAECPAAAGNVGRLVGQPLSQLRHSVLDLLAGTACCTHLNDMLRALAEVPTLSGSLHAES
jgi:hypothetical protein